MAPASSKMVSIEQLTTAVALHSLDHGPEEASSPSSSSSRATGSGESSDPSTISTHVTDESTALAFVANTGSVARAPRPNRTRNPPYCNAIQTTPRWDLILPNEPLGIDIEFQEYLLDTDIWEGHANANGKRHFRLGRVSVVNTLGQVVLDVYVYYRTEKGIAKFLPPAWLKFNVTWQDLISVNGAQPAEKVERWLKSMFTGRTAVLHGGEHDLHAFWIHPDVLLNSTTTVVDTQQLYAYQVYNREHPGLEPTAAVIMGKVIQVNGHSSIEDAQTAMELYLLKFPNAGRVAPTLAAPVQIAPVQALPIQTPPAPKPTPAPPVKTWASIAAASSSTQIAVVTTPAILPTVTPVTQPNPPPTAGQQPQRGRGGGYRRGRGGRGRGRGRGHGN
ncbi:RNA exonuclease 4 [Pseudocercospora fuligena]|uniref:RNA exonuclease 4 n=1 Tax=Pseudocercospora fuligena TaxID=685502 RepID=A0A8H6VDW8_9PEZI|nr:RNA exonuclease 4 [Pseudocercospora fuligena]